jgi:hypothetical protein
VNDPGLLPHADDGAPSEVWLLDVLDPGGPRDLSSVTTPAGWRALPHGMSVNGTALLATAGADELILEGGAAARLRLLRHPQSGSARVRGDGGSRTIALNAPGTGVAELRADGTLADGAATDPITGQRRALDLDAWLAEVAARRPAAVGLVHPDWRGVRAATEQHLSYVLAVPEQPPEDDVAELAERIAATGVPAVVSAGLPPGHRALVRALHDRGVRCLVTWHATLLQHGEPVNRDALEHNVALAREGVIERIGFVKAGMASAFARRGIAAATVLNHLRRPPRPAPAADGTLRSAGLWSVAPVWRKPPYAMLAACAELDPVPVVHASGQDPALVALAAMLGVPLEVSAGPVAAEQMPTALAACDVNLYVTLSECAPMLALESLAAGRPCLIGPVTHYFDEDAYLEERLVVERPDRHERIAAAMRRVAAEHDDLMRHVREQWWPSYQARARRSVAAFVGAGEGDLV